MTVTCSGCGTGGQPEGARFCFSCGAVLQLPVCGECGVELVPGARFCSGCGAAQVADGQAAAPAAPGAGAGPGPGAVSARRVTSVLFGDLVGFTALSESRDSEEVRELLSRYFEAARQVIERYGGTVEKFIGDAVMAVWGVPTTHEDDAERAVRAGLELVGSVGELGADIGVPDLAMRVGIVTGEVAVTVGAQGQGMVAGDAVNTASRVQSIATPGHVWVDETTRLLAASAITFADAGSHALKGKADPVPLWSVRAVVAGVGGGQRADGLEAPLVGRERELRLVKELFHGVEESRRPALLVVGGEAGVGKSRLGWEFEKYVDGLSRPVRWHGGRCLAYGEGVAFFALADALRPRVQPSRDDDGADSPVALSDGLARWVPDAEERDWLEPRLGALLGVGSAGSFVREDLFSAWTTFLHRVGEDEHPVVLLIDDAHNADEGLIAFVEHLLAVGDFGCMVVLLGRSGLLDAHPSLASNRRATVLHLEALSDPSTGTLLDGLVAGLPPAVREALVHRAEGIPLYAVETVRSMIDRDLVVPRGGQYVLADPENLDLSSVGAPASLQTLIAARLDTLSPAQRRVVEHGSVVGNSFAREQIARLCPDLEDLDQVLAGLVRLQVLQREASRFSAELGQFQFVQSAVRQVAYAGLSRRERKALHLAVAVDLASREDTAGELAAIIAQHYVEALDAVPDDPDVPELTAATIAQLRRAARRAADLGSPREVAGHLRTALSRSTEDLEAATIEADLADALKDAGDYAAGVAHATSARDAFAAAGDRRRAGGAAATLGRCLIGEHRVAEALEAALPWYEELRDDVGAARVALALCDAVGGAQMRMSMDFREVAERRVRLAELVGDEGAIAEAYNSLALHYALTGTIGLGMVLLESAAARARVEHQPRILGRTLINLNGGLNGEDARRAVEVGREAMQVSLQQGLSGDASVAISNLVTALWTVGEWDEALRLGEQEAIEETERRGVASVRQHVARARGEDWSRPIANDVVLNDDAAQGWEDIGEAGRAAALGHPDAVARAVRTVETYYEQSGVYDDFVFIWQLAVEIARHDDDRAALDRLAAVVDDHVGSRPGLGLRAHLAMLHADLARRDGAPAAEVEELLREALAGFERWGSAPYAARAAAELGRLLLEQDRPEEAAGLLAAARETFTALGARAWLEEHADVLEPGGAVRRPAPA